MGKVGVDRAPFYRRLETHCGSGGETEDPIPLLKGVKKMRRVITGAVDRVHVGDARGDIWLNLFDETRTVNPLKGINKYKGYSSGTWHSIHVADNATRRFLCNGWQILGIPDEVLGTFWKGL